MRARILIVAALMAGVWAAARFKPTSENSRTIDGDAAGSREILLVDAPGSEAPLVSDLEARRTAELALVRPVKTADRRAAPKAGEAKAGDAAAKAHDPTTMAALELVPEMRTTTSSLDGPLHVAQGPMPVAALPGEGGGRSDGDGAGAGGSRGPAIIIRGGTGSPNDPCARHGPRILGPGIAINSSLPPLGGGVLVNDRAPRGRGGTARIGMSRGGIR